MVSMFRGVIGFLDKLGIYDVVLPFLLVFTVVYAILEKTKIFGTERIDGTDYPKKNLNSITAFVMAFFVVASTKLVAIISAALANFVLLLLLIVTFLMAVGAMYSGKDEFDIEKAGMWKHVFIAIAAVSVLAIFLNQLGYLTLIYNFVMQNFQAQWFGAIVFVALIILFMMWITGSFDKKDHKETKPEGEDNS
ncbi:hypothetical protein GOV04_01980 [Candidatus Woesearchaeota archaeon]|nr:hypothetical protein [Candidatus Woesearchaeota archaeon]